MNKFICFECKKSFSSNRQLAGHLSWCLYPSSKEGRGKNISISKKGKTPIFSNPKERGKNISKKLKGRIFSDEWKKKIKEAKQGSKLNLSDEERNRRVETMIGNNNPSKNPEVRKKQSEAGKINWKRPEFRNSHTGANSATWQGGLSKFPYSLDWEESIKEAVRKRDGYCCQLCLISENSLQGNYHEKLDVHHIDYDKTNCDIDNLITLCKSCHPKTNFNRKGWLSVFAIQ